MVEEKFLFIGGPLDKQWIRPAIPTPIPAIVSLPKLDDKIPNRHNIHEQAPSYYIRLILGTCSEPHTVYRVSTLSEFDAIQRLLECYGP